VPAVTITRPTDSTSRLGASYWRLFSAASLSSLADGTLKVALPLLARSSTDAPLAIAGVGFAAMLPWLLLSLPAGAIVDRSDRRTVLLAANMVRAVILTLSAFLALVGVGSIALLYLVAFGAGVAETFYATASSAIVPQLVDRTQLDRANALQQIADQATNQFAGPALGGVLTGLGVGLALGGPAAVWIVATAMLVALNGSFRARRRGDVAQVASLRAAMVIGLRFLAGSVALRSVCLCAAVTNFASAAAAAVFVVYAVGAGSALGLRPAVFGLLMAASAVGTVLGSLLIRPATRALGLRTLLAINALTQAVQIVVPVLTHDVVSIGAAYALAGLGVALWNVGTVTMRQRIAPVHLLGRVTSTNRLISWGSLALGALAGGLVAQAAGLVTLFWGAAALSLAGALALLPLTPATVDGEAGDAGVNL
jgi:MFS family permease